MGAKTKTVGGGSATGVANDWNAFLSNQLNGGGQGTVPNNQGWKPGDPMMEVSKGQFGALNNNNNPQTPGSQQNSNFQNAFSNMLGGKVNDISGAGGALNNFFNKPTEYSNQYTSQNYNAPTLSQLGTNFGQGQSGMANISGMMGIPQSNFDTQKNLGNVTSGQDGTFNSLLQQGQGMLGQNGGFSAASAGPDVSLQGGMDFKGALDTLGNDPYKETLLKRSLAENNARFGAEGAGALGTGAQYSNALMQSDFAANDASQRRAQAMQLMGQDLNERSTGANVGLQNRGQNMQTSIANMQGGLQGNQNMNNTFNQLMQGTLQGRGQDLQTGLGMRGQNLDQLGMGANQAMGNANLTLQGNNQNMNAMLNNQQMGNNWQQGNQQINNNAMQNNNMNSINAANNQNNFNLNNAGNMAQYGQGANQLNAQNLQSMIGQGLNMNQMGNQNIQAMLSNLFGGFQQSNGLGTAQAQTIQQPSAWGQAANMGLQLAGSYLSGGGKIPGFGGGGGGIQQMPGGGIARPGTFGAPGGMNTGWGGQGGGYSGPVWG